MPKRGPCKFFAHGACLKGEHCEFPHERKDPPNNIYKFYQKGVCAYGSRCRYDHFKVSRAQSLTPWNIKSKDVDESRIASPSEVSICSSAAADYCSQGEKCPHIHGDMCPTCRKLCLHPFHPEEREEHMKNCEILHNHLEALKQSLEIQCSICLERVLSKPTAAERKFGLLSECDHPFCISCIRKWRRRMDVNGTLRTCPVCHKLSHFVIPSVISYATSEEKHEIIDSFRAKLKLTGCKHFDFDNGNCPFGTSCYYKHAYRDGILEPLLHLGAADCNTVIAEDVRLSDSLANMHLK